MVNGQTQKNVPVMVVMNASSHFARYAIENDIEPLITLPLDNMSEEPFDVVTDTLQKHIDRLWDMSKNKDEWGIMDHIRMEQIDQLKQAIRLWKNRPHE